MPEPSAITPWHWGIFVIAVLVFLALDLGVFHRRAHVVGFREAFTWTAVWISVAVCFGLFIAPEFVHTWDREEKEQFLTGYILELSLSMDNVFVIALIFAYFGLKLEFQHRVLFWGILGALIMRGGMIWAGSALIDRFHWLLYIMGAFLVFTALKMLFSEEDPEVEPEKNFAVRMARKFFPISDKFDDSKFITKVNGKRLLTPLALVLLMVETTDVIFAVDSIPAIFAVTTDRFIVFTSNVFAILGLRSLYFVLAGAISYFQFLKIGLSVVLALIGGKMLVAPWYHMSTTLSLGLVVGIILASIVISVMVGRKQAKTK